MKAIVTNVAKTAVKSAMNTTKELLQLTVNNQKVQVAAGSTLLDAIRASGAFVPTLCYHPEFKQRANCRMCLVEVDGKDKHPVPACRTLATEGAKVVTDSPALEQFRKTNLQFMLSRHPNDCKYCNTHVIVDYNCHSSLSGVSLVRDIHWLNYPHTPPYLDLHT